MMRLLQALSLLIVAFPASAADRPAKKTVLNRSEDLVCIDNGDVRVGANRAMGASITWLSTARYPENMVNSADPGRLIQQSYYAGLRLDRTSEGQSKAWSPWAWNPIQGGGVGSWARVLKCELLENQTIYSETIPKLWDMPDEEAAAIMRQSTAFEPGMPNVIVVRCELACRRENEDRWGPARLTPQEIPACYFTRNFSDVRSYLGDGRWQSEVQPPGPPWGKANPVRRAMACFDAGGEGIAIFSPCSTQPWNFGPHGAGSSRDPAAGPCVHVAPIDRVLLGPGSTYRYRYWLATGSETQLAKQLDALWSRYAGEKSVLEN